MTRTAPAPTDHTPLDEPHLTGDADAPAGHHIGAPPWASVEQIEAYAAALRRAVVQALAHRPPLGGITVDDVAQEVVLTFLESPLRIMATYREPWIYARASTASRTVDLGRRERSQRGEGARLVADADGMRSRRVVVHLDAVVEGEGRRGGEGSLAVAPAVEDLVLDRITADALLSTLSVADRRLVECVDVWQCTVTETAQLVGLARETVSRRLSSVRRALATEVTP